MTDLDLFKIRVLTLSFHKWLNDMTEYSVPTFIDYNKYNRGKNHESPT